MYILAFFKLFDNTYKDDIEKNMTLRTARVIKIGRFGNSPGENEEMVNRISIPLIIVELTIMGSLDSNFIFISIIRPPPVITVADTKHIFNPHFNCQHIVAF